jgi:outer membrane protein assembly factor BamB
MKAACFCILLWACVADSGTAEPAAERQWPRWRGPRDNGCARGGIYPTGWKDPKQIVWKAKLPGIGCSTPAVWNEQIFLTCPIEGHNAVMAFDWQGKVTWKAVFGPEVAGKHRNGSGCNPSPVTDGQHVYVYFKNGELAGLDFSGKILWKTNLQERFAKDTLYWDLGTSPALTEKSVIMAVMHTGQSYLAAFDKATGDLQWKIARNYTTPPEGDQSYSTPNVIERDGQQIIIVWGAEHLTAHAADDGRMLWTCGGFNPEENRNWVSVASAVIDGNVAIVPYGRGSRVTAVKLDGMGDVTETHRLWTRNDTGSFVPTPVIDDGRVYFVRDGGEVDCLDRDTGKTLWSDQFPKNRNKFYASPVIAGGKLYAPREDGVVFVADISDKFQLLSENDMGERVIASPVPVAGKLLIRGEENLFCIKP